MKKLRAQALVALLGPEGTFSSYAARKLGKQFCFQYFSTIAGVFKAVNGGVFGFLPIRNKIVGPILKVAPYFTQGPHGRYHAIQIVRYPVKLALVAQKKLPLSLIRTVYCVKAAADQCRHFLKKHLSGVRIVDTYDSNGEVYKKIVQCVSSTVARTGRARSSLGLAAPPCGAQQSLAGRGVAAIGPVKSAKLFGLVVLAKNIQDDPNDWTEFVLFRGKPKVSPAYARLSRFAPSDSRPLPNLSLGAGPTRPAPRSSKRKALRKNPPSQKSHRNKK